MQPKIWPPRAPGAWRRSAGLPYTSTVQHALGNCVPSQNDPLSEIRKLSAIDQARIAALKQGQTMRDLDPLLRHASYGRRANRRVSDGTPSESRGGAPAGLRRLIADEPSKAITSAAVREFVHPFEPRMLTLREAAILQTFPADFRFLGSRSEIATMIGNAIPPLFAQALGQAITNTLSQPKVGPVGTLTEFIVTRADAMCPALF